jgi:hypothetical protein
MKLSFLLVIVCLFSSLAFSETLYVRKSLVSDGVTEAQGEAARDVIRNTAKESGQKIVSTAGQAASSLRAAISKTADGKFLVKIVKKHGAKTTEAGEGTDENIDSAVHTAAVASLSSFKATLVSTEPTEHVVVREASSSSQSQTAETPANCPQDTKKLNYIKNFGIALGPVISNNLIGTNGTKFAITLSYFLPINEHFDVSFNSDTNLNTASTGGTGLQTFNVGGTYFLNDRSNDFSPYIKLDIGYGGANRSNDGTGEGGGTLGVNLFRTQTAAMNFYVREFVLMTNNGSNPANYPNVTQVMVGVLF